MVYRDKICSSAAAAITATYKSSTLHSASSSVVSRVKPTWLTCY